MYKTNSNGSNHSEPGNNPQSYSFTPCIQTAVTHLLLKPTGPDKDTNHIADKNHIHQPTYVTEINATKFRSSTQHDSTVSHLDHMMRHSLYNITSWQKATILKMVGMYD